VLAGAAIAPFTGVIAGGGWFLFQGAHLLLDARSRTVVRARIALPSSPQPLVVRGAQLRVARIEGDADGWSLRLGYEDPDRPGLDLDKLRNLFKEVDPHARTTIVSGAEAVRVAGQLLPALNEAGGGRKHVRDAVRTVDENPDPLALFGTAARSHRSMPLMTLPQHLRLALEMASHEEQERRALAGELSELEAAWRVAEEIAAIADSIGNEEIDTRVEELKSAALVRRSPEG
jgi:hypothetical protein